MMPRPTDYARPYILIHTDGSCLGNPGPGGYAAVLRKIDDTGRVVKRLALTGSDPDTTNNRMELMAAIRGLAALRRAILPVMVVTDSQYVRKGITEWIGGWKANGWRTTNRKPVKNDDLWRELDALAAVQQVHWHWTKGHGGDPFNEEVDGLARTEAGQQATVA